MNERPRPWKEIAEEYRKYQDNLPIPEPVGGPCQYVADCALLKYLLTTYGVDMRTGCQLWDNPLQCVRNISAQMGNPAPLEFPRPFGKEESKIKEVLANSGK